MGEGLFLEPRKPTSSSGMHSLILEDASQGEVSLWIKGRRGLTFVLWDASQGKDSIGTNVYHSQVYTFLLPPDRRYIFGQGSAERWKILFFFNPSLDNPVS